MSIASLPGRRGAEAMTPLQKGSEIITETPKNKPSAQASTDVIGTFAWFELRTRRPRESLGFFTEILGWRTSEMDMGEA